MPIGGVMVLGHDFHSETGFRASLARGTEVPATTRNGYRIAPTWTTLRKLFVEAAVPLGRCFFTKSMKDIDRAGPLIVDVRFGVRTEES